MPDVITLPECFRNAGYEVAGGGKVYHHTPGFNPPDQWDTYFDLRFDDPWDRCHPPYTPHWSFPHLDPPKEHPFSGLTPFHHEYDWGVLDRPESEYGDAATVDWATAYLSRPHDRPFFLAVGTFRPHLPWYAPRAYFERYPLEHVVLPLVLDSDLEDVPPIGRTFAANARDRLGQIQAQGLWEQAVQGYLAAISFADAQIGRLFRALDESEHVNNTVVVFFSDNGFHMGEKNHIAKCTLWQRSTHVPFIVRGPGVRPGRRCGRAVNLQDVYPTLIDLCGLTAPPERDGRSLKPLLTDPDATWNQPSLCTFQRYNHALCMDEWRYIRYADGGEELYDRRNDPNEWENLAGKTEFDTVKRDLQNFLPQQNAAPVRAKKEYDFDAQRYEWHVRS
jgi:arylsulfatase A-like enzyme